MTTLTSSVDIQKVYVAPEGYSLFRPNAKSDETISAVEIRHLGLALPENIPDCAIVPAAAVWVKMTAETPTQQGMMGFNTQFIFLDCFSWVEAKIEIEKKG